jgi:Threonine synthase
MKFYLKCTKCGERYDSDYAWPRCSKCGGLLEVTYEYESIELPSDFKTAFVKQWKYKPFMPIKRRPVTAGEGGTRLKKVRISSRCLLKNRTR